MRGWKTNPTLAVKGPRKCDRRLEQGQKWRKEFSQAYLLTCFSVMREIRLVSCWWEGSRRGWRTAVLEEQRGNCSCEWALGWFLRCSRPSETKETHSPFLEPDISCAGQTPTFLVPRVLNCSRISNCVHLPPTADSHIARQTQTQILARPFTSCVTSGKLQPTKVSTSSSVKWGKAIRTFTCRLLQSHAAESRTCNSYYKSVIAQSQLWI